MTADPPLVLITGALGRLGRATVSSFLEHGYRVRGLDLPSRANRRAARRIDPRLELIWGDIRDEALLIRATRNVNAVMHHAAMLPPASEAWPKMAEEVNVGGTRRLLNVLATHAPDAFFLYPSSVTVYGADLDRTPPVHLDSPLKPSDHYTRHKLACEAMVTNSPLAWSIHRLGVVLHPDDRDTRPETLKMLFNTSLDSRMEYLHPNDAARAQRHNLEREETWRRTFLVGGGSRCQITQRTLFETVFNALGVGIPPEAAFGGTPLYTDWMDTKPSEAALTYQRMGFADFQRAIHHSMRHLRRALLLFRPCVRYYLLHHSEPWRTRRERLSAPDDPARS